MQTYLRFGLKLRDCAGSIYGILLCFVDKKVQVFDVELKRLYLTFYVISPTYSFHHPNPGIFLSSPLNAIKLSSIRMASTDTNQN